MKKERKVEFPIPSKSMNSSMALYLSSVNSATPPSKTEEQKTFVFRTAYQSQGATMSSAQINVRTSPIIADELDRIVGTGFFGDRTEAVNEALKFLIRFAEQIESLSKKVKTDVSLTDVLMSSRDGEDL